MSRKRLLTIDGRTQTLDAWSDEAHQDKQMIRQRLYLGWSARAAVFTPNKKRIYVLNGEKYTLAEITAKNGTISKAGMHDRIMSGMTVEEAVQKPNSFGKRNMKSPCGIPCFECPHSKCRYD